MHHAVSSQDGNLFIESTSLSSIASQFGTPCYVYSKAVISNNFLAYQSALADKEHLICYAVKANSNIAVLQTLAELGAGFDIVSIGELERVLRAGGNPAKVVFSGVAKTASEMQRALELGIHCFNVESEAELELLNSTAASCDAIAAVSLRVNPDVDAQTHPYISTGLKENKFGIDINLAAKVYQRAAQMAHINVVGVDCHIGSQLVDIAPFVAALERLLALVDELAELGITLQHIDIGGGLGVRYDNEQPPTPQSYMSAILPLLTDRSETLVLEPGRSITANAGVMLTQVQYLKSNGEKNFAIVDAAMNDMIRPALYQAWMDIQPISAGISDNALAESAVYDVVGPVCETGDFLAKDRSLAISAGDYLCLMSAGAYGFVMSSNYNSRPRAPEVMVDGDQVYLVRRRETIEDLLSGESLLPAAAR
ncbi:diaminopimelate decarboxylase [Porticoccaceae bacterium]|nr:diaminopimelate decarboxylase [Porticoccaceae bacterium]MDB9706500.1 diaminopimelate decarboxylase [Porticoccaceae bacterium]MDB9805209.1 diaminopimelate decarboxylase [Porticoccaceae bacterium]MDB9949711.1 diaminopimelate decarboxylase [Porticoccaceae bacterium]MDB9970996.1 diaminopimelate decarboxylase [Porticoccaceae bacterium]